MSRSQLFSAEPWRLRESQLHLDLLARSESMFALSNGHIGLRGTLDEGEPHVLPGSYLNSMYELWPLPHAESAYGYPECGQSIVNVTNGKLIRLLVDDEPFDVRYGWLTTHRRTLDFRAGALSRDVEWTSPAGCSVRVTSVRLVSLVQRSVAAICYTVEPVNRSMRVVVQSELVANESLPAYGEADPRAGASLTSPLTQEEQIVNGAKAIMVHQTRHSGLRLAAGMDHVVDAPVDFLQHAEGYPDGGRVTFAGRLRPGQRLRIVKFLGYGWSGRRGRPAVRAQVEAALAAARQTGWNGLLAEQREYLDAFWASADVEIDGDPEIQQAVRFALFHVLQSAARAERRPIASKGLTGPGYDGHTFWDSETFVHPVLTYTQPSAAADMLRWRQMTLPLARDRARQLGLRGAAFPWRTIGGRESSGYWPAGTAAFHVNADIADAVIRYVDATGDHAFERETGLELLVETARLWASLGHFGADGRFRIDGVTGPDEYSAIADNNVFTNLMAQQNLQEAAEAVERHRDRAAELRVDQAEPAHWREVAAAMYVAYDEQRGVHPQSDAFTQHDRWDFAATGPDRYPLMLHFPYFDLYRKQVVKQPDLVLALYLRGDAFTPEQKERDFVYYEPLTVRDSSLSACVQAVIAAETGHIELAYDYLGEAALMDLNDLQHNTRDGLHLASLAGTWIATVAGLGGMRARHGKLSFRPRLPSGISRLAFRLHYRERRISVTITHAETRYRVAEGHEIQIEHHDQTVVIAHEPIRLPNPPAEYRPRPAQPPGREPQRRSPRRDPGNRSASKLMDGREAGIS